MTNLIHRFYKLPFNTLGIAFLTTSLALWFLSLFSWFFLNESLALFFLKVGTLTFFLTICSAFFFAVVNDSL